MGRLTSSTSRSRLAFERPLGTCSGRAGPNDRQERRLVLGQRSSDHRLSSAASAIGAELTATEGELHQFHSRLSPKPAGTAGCTDRGRARAGSSILDAESRSAGAAGAAPKIETPLTAVSATATSGTAGNAIDGYNDWSSGVNNTLCKDGSRREPLDVDGHLASVRDARPGNDYGAIDLLEYLPATTYRQHRGEHHVVQVSVSSDNVRFTQVAAGNWPRRSDVPRACRAPADQFLPRAARYVGLEADTVSGGGTGAIIGEARGGDQRRRGAGGTGGASGGGSGGAMGAAGGATGAGGLDGGADGTVSGGIADGGTGGGTGAGGDTGAGGRVGSGGASGSGEGGQGAAGSSGRGRGAGAGCACALAAASVSPIDFLAQTIFFLALAGYGRRTALRRRSRRAPR